mmetsp:Transcript_9523/g.13375  ORF Transcript_9523/g.13375 Transcript_9523/m.13375 type:complete len:225 (-) Transcript_9523:1111-1785(-)
MVPCCVGRYTLRGCAALRAETAPEGRGALHAPLRGRVDPSGGGAGGPGARAGDGGAQTAEPAGAAEQDHPAQGRARTPRGGRPEAPPNQRRGPAGQRGPSPPAGEGQAIGPAGEAGARPENPVQEGEGRQRAPRPWVCRQLAGNERRCHRRNAILSLQQRRCCRRCRRRHRGGGAPVVCPPVGRGAAGEGQGHWGQGRAPGAVVTGEAPPQKQPVGAHGRVLPK